MDLSSAIAKLESFNTTEELAAFLGNERIKGQCGNPQACVLAKYLATAIELEEDELLEQIEVQPSPFLDAAIISVTYVKGASWEVPGALQEFEIALPSMANDLARDFDRGRWPNLMTEDSVPYIPDF